MFTQQDLQNLLVFMSRVELKGNEASTHVEITNKIKALMDTKQPQEDKQEDDSAEEGDE